LVIPEFQIVEVSLNDLKILQELSRRTFYQSFAAVNKPENIKFFLDHHYSEEKLLSELLNPDSRFFFASQGDDPMGYLKINQGMAQTVLPNDAGLEIERIYIDQAFKGRGIGKLFIDRAVESGKRSGANYLWLGVWEHNERAIRFYEKNGFHKFSKHIFNLGNDPQTDFLMKRDI
jgi:ribosomal protein S18 acetylase RimI-like enzyme